MQTSLQNYKRFMIFIPVVNCCCCFCRFELIPAHPVLRNYELLFHTPPVCDVNTMTHRMKTPFLTITNRCFPAGHIGVDRAAEREVAETGSCSHRRERSTEGDGGQDYRHREHGSSRPGRNVDEAKQRVGADLKTINYISQLFCLALVYNYLVGPRSMTFILCLVIAVWSISSRKIQATCIYYQHKRFIFGLHINA